MAGDIIVENEHVIPIMEECVPSPSTITDINDKKCKYMSYIIVSYMYFQLTKAQRQCWILVISKKALMICTMTKTASLEGIIVKSNKFMDYLF